MHRGHNEGNIRQRTDGRWEVRLSAGIDYKTGKPKRTSTCCNTKQEAIAILQEQAHDIRVNGWRDPMSVTLGEWYEYWLVTYMKDKVKQSTYMSYRGYGNKHFCVHYSSTGRNYFFTACKEYTIGILSAKCFILNFPGSNSIVCWKQSYGE